MEKSPVLTVWGRWVMGKGGEWRRWGVWEVESKGVGSREGGK